jgi:predicted nucleic acid-binding protein
LGADAATFRVWARLIHWMRQSLIEDAMIATTAAIHNLTVVTRNVKDFRELGASTFNPFEIGR